MMNTKKLQIEKTATETYELVKGEYSPSDANEIINDLFSKKINFHGLKGFSQLIRFGTTDPKTEKRMNELNLALEQAKDLISEAKASGKSVRINSTVLIELF